MITKLNLFILYYLQIGEGPGQIFLMTVVWTSPLSWTEFLAMLLTFSTRTYEEDEVQHMKTLVFLLWVNLLFNVD